MSHFEAASAWLTSSSSDLPNDIKLELYGLFKVINTHSGPTGARPGIFSFEGRAKYDSWARIAAEYEGDIEGAQERYVAIARRVGWSEEAEVRDVDEDEDAAPRKEGGGMGFGPSVSVLEREEESGGESLVHDAASEGDLDALRQLVGADRSLVEAKDEYGFTPLHLAADRGRLEAVRLLLNLGADKSILDPDGQTALDLATVSGRDEIAQLLQ